MWAMGGPCVLAREAPSYEPVTPDDLKAYLDGVARVIVQLDATLKRLIELLEEKDPWR